MLNQCRLELVILDFEIFSTANQNKRIKETKQWQSSQYLNLTQTCVFEISKIPKSFSFYSLYQGSYKVLECNILQFRLLFAAYNKLM